MFPIDDDIPTIEDKPGKKVERVKTMIVPIKKVLEYRTIKLGRFWVGVRIDEVGEVDCGVI